MPPTRDLDFYQEVAARLPCPELIFLNYGYEDAVREPCDWILPVDQRYRPHLSLVKHVMSGVDMAGRTVLEIGSGRGGNCYYLSRYTQAKSICGVDLCEANVRFCNAVHHLPNVKFSSGDAEHLPYCGNSFDVVLNLESSHCYPHFERFLAEVQRVLRPHGTFCYVDLWSLEFLEIDWEARKKALDDVALVLLAEEDISKPVLRALKSKAGLPETIRALANDANRAFVDEVVERLNLVWLTLAAGLFSYRSWRFRKP